jgi:ribonuclease BN (tRNA processing enzyme)
MHPKNLEARIEILTDGSDNTGAAAVFLTIRRCCSHVQCPDGDDPSPSSDGHDDCYYQESPRDVDDGTIVARYNLSGITSLTGRLSSDQSYKLLQNGAFSAILVPSLVKFLGCDGGIMRGECMGGLPALFLNLIQAGYKIAGGGNNNDNKKKLDSTEYSSDSGIDCETKGYADTSYNDVSIVGPSALNNTIDGLLDTMFGNSRRRPSLRLCEVPHGDEWYEVYEDSYVCIWAQSIPHHDTSATTRLCKKCSSGSKDSDAASKDDLEECSLAFIVMLRSQTNKKEHQLNTKRQRTTSRPDHSRPYSFAIMTQPTSSFHCKGTCQKCGTNIVNNFREWDVFRNLPQEIVSDRNGSSFLLDFILHLNPLTGEKVQHSKKNPTDGNETIDAIRVEKRRIYVPSWMVDAKLAQHHLALFPSDIPDNKHADNGLLIRAWHRSKVLHDALPFAFPLNMQKALDQEPQIIDNNKEHDDGARADALKLASCTSVTLNGWGSTHCHPSFTFLPRSDAIRIRCHESSFSNWNEISQGDNGLSPKCKGDFTKMVDSLKCAYSGGTCYCNGCVGMQQQRTVDDNEIDLDDSSCEYEDTEDLTKEGGGADRDIPPSTIDVKSAHLLFLGTGCATPSPCRGSSGMGLFMPTSTYQPEKSSYKDELWLSAIIECGEGTLNSLSRHIKCFSCEQSSLDNQLSHVNFIWISHAHLDHYGDLSSVVQAVANAKRKVHTARPVVVIAPPKVLKYLRVMLQSQASSKTEDRQFIGVTHRDFQTSPFVGHVRSMIFNDKLMMPISSQLDVGRQTAKYYNPFVSIQNVEVEHCRDAYALLLELCIPTRNDAFDRFVLCFSGDTRPSAMLTKACVMYSSSMMQRKPPFPISLLIHEATFLDDTHGREEALRKRHSTVREALDVATSIKAEACLLTHFSQRYSHVSADDVCSGDGNDSYPESWGVASDGMLIPLTKRGMASLIPLTKCIDAIFSLPDRHVD